MKKKVLEYFLKPFNAYNVLILDTQKAQDSEIAEISIQKGFHCLQAFLLKTIKVPHLFMDLNVFFLV